MSAYFDALCQAMQMLAEDPRALFIGQAVEYPGTAMSKTLEKVPSAKKIEFPVAEDFQLGASIGLSLAGALPVCVFPRWSFLLLAFNQLVLHLDKLPAYSRGGYRPKVIIRVGVPTEVPLDPGPQHLGDFTNAVESMLDSVHIYRLRTPSDVQSCYLKAFVRHGSTILVEYAELYDEKGDKKGN